MTTKVDLGQPLYVDANIPMYAAGRDHPYRGACLAILRHIARGTVEAVTSAEVHQEILHRYLSLRRPEQAREVSRSLQTIVPATLPVTLADVERARTLSLDYPQIAARDLIHVAVMLNNGLTQILSVDKHFDAVIEVRRISPDDLTAWLAPESASGGHPGKDVGT